MKRGFTAKAGPLIINTKKYHVFATDYANAPESKKKIVIHCRIHCRFIVLIIDNNYALIRTKCINNGSDNCLCIQYYAYVMRARHMFSNSVSGNFMIKFQQPGSLFSQLIIPTVIRFQELSLKFQIILKTAFWLGRGNTVLKWSCRHRILDERKLCRGCQLFLYF